MKAPLEFIIAARDFDRNLLVAGSGEPGSDTFREAVTSFFADQFGPMGGSVIVSVDADAISVFWLPEEATVEPREYAAFLLEAGRLREAATLLSLLLSVSPDDDELLYNLGMAQSDLGELAEAKRHLARAVELAPGHINALVALAVAQQRSGETDAAVRNLERAVAREPGNGYARRSLGSTLGAQERFQEAEVHFREAVRLLPYDAVSSFGLAQALEGLGDRAQVEEADLLYQQAIEADNDDVAEAAKQARRRLAQRGFRSAAGSSIRMDAVMYCLHALQTFAEMPASETQKVTFEIAILGQTGLDVNNPDKKYTLRSWPGEFSGLQLMSTMYVGFKQVKPDLDIGFDLSAEYAVAQDMYGAGASRGERGAG